MEIEEITPNASPRVHKRKLASDHFTHDPDCPPKRLSPFLNTPKQRRDERRKILKIASGKLRAIDDPEQFLRRSVLLNNQYRRLREDMIDEKKYGYGSCDYLANKNSSGLYSHTRPVSPCTRRPVLSEIEIGINFTHSAPVMCDNDFNKVDKITDDMSDILAQTVNNLITDNDDNT